MSQYTSKYTGAQIDAKLDDVSNKVDKVSGKGLSTNDYTTAEKTKLSGIETGAQKNATNTVVDASYVHTDNNYTSAEKTKLSGIDMSTKVDKVTGKGLSTNDYTTAEKTKLTGIEAGAQVNPILKTINGTSLIGSGNIEVSGDNYLEQAKAIVSQWKPMTFEVPQSENTYDILCFAGQSNMCGRATLADFANAEDILLSIATQKAVTYQTSSTGTTVGSTMNTIVEPLGINGSSGYGLVPAFINAYYYASGRKSVCCFKSVGGEKIDKFLPYTINRTTGQITQTPQAYYASMVGFINDTKAKLTAANKTVGKILLIWCQGEADADYLGTDSSYCTPYEKTLTTKALKISYYKEKFRDMVNGLVTDCNLDHACIIRIGHLHASGNIKYESIIEAHNELGKEYNKCSVVSTFFAGAKAYKENDGTVRDLMRDSWHYKPEGYVRAGYEAGINTAHVVTSSFQCKPVLVEWNQAYLDSISESMAYGKDRKVDKYIYSPQRFDMEYAKGLAADKVTAITVSPSSMTLEVNGTVQLVASVYPETASEQGVTFVSSNPQVLSVTDTGLVTGVSVGTATITITSVDSPSVTTTFNGTVSSGVIAVSSVTLDRSTASILTDDTLQLTATVLPATATNKNVIWSTSDSSVATVNAGLVTALREGNVTIRASAESDSTKYAECVFTITQEVITTTYIDADFTGRDTIDSLVESGTLVVPDGSDTSLLTYSAASGMICNSNALPYGLKFASMIQVPDLWCLEFETKWESNLDDNNNANLTWLSGTDSTQRSHTHALSCLAPCVFFMYSSANHVVAIRTQEDVSTQQSVASVFLCDGNFHTYKLQMVASYVLQVYRDGVKIGEASCTSNNGYWGYMLGVHQGYNYAAQYKAKTGMYIKSFKLTSTSA